MRRVCGDLLPLVQAGRLRQVLFDGSHLRQMAQRKGISVAQLLHG